MLNLNLWKPIYSVLRYECYAQKVREAQIILRLDDTLRIYVRKISKFLRSHLSAEVWPKKTFEIYYLLVEEKAHASLGQGDWVHFLAPVFSLIYKWLIPHPAGKTKALMRTNPHPTGQNSMPKPQSIPNYAPYFPGVEGSGDLHWQVH